MTKYLAEAIRQVQSHAAQMGKTANLIICRNPVTCGSAGPCPNCIRIDPTDKRSAEEIAAEVVKVQP